MRGLASFVSFLLLFAFALGQSSLSALADDPGTAPVTAEHREPGAPPTTLGVVEPGIDVEKQCPHSAPFGEEISYPITVSNVGGEVLTGLTVTDTLIGDITSEFPDTTLDVGEVDTVTVGFTPQGDPYRVTNTVIAEADGDISAIHVSALANCTTYITHQPGIDVTMSCPESVPFGEDIEFTITVTNTGNEAARGPRRERHAARRDITGDFAFDFAEPVPGR